MNKDTYKIGDQITFGHIRPKWWSKDGSMDKFLGQTVIIESIYWVPAMNSGTFRFKNCDYKQFWLNEIEESNTVYLNIENLKPEVLVKIRQNINDIFGNKQLINKMNTQQKTQAILNVANALCNAQNQFTNLELKNELRKKYPNEVWNQLEVSVEMMDLADKGHFDYTHNGTYRTYFATPSLQGSQSQTNSNQSMVSKLITLAQTKNTTPSVQKTVTKPQMTTKRIGRKKALEIIQNTNGKFFSVRFEKKNGENRLMGVQYVKGTKPDPLGYVLLRDLKAKKSKSVNLQTLSEIKTNNTLYKVS